MPTNFVNFIIGIDQEGDELFATSNPKMCNPDEGVIVFFRRDVMHKYYYSPNQYSVSEDRITSQIGWSLPLVDFQKNYVAVFLYEIGLNLAYEEQMYWRSFNIEPVSETSGRSKYPMADWVFKRRFDEFNTSWARKYGWSFFKPLEAGDLHYWKGLHIPLNEDQSEFDHQILSVVKIFIDSLDEKNISGMLGEGAKGFRGIALLEKMLEESGLPDVQEHTHFLKGVYWLRSSGVGHLKGANFEEAS